MITKTTVKSIELRFRWETEHTETVPDIKKEKKLAKLTVQNAI